MHEAVRELEVYIARGDRLQEDEDPLVTQKHYIMNTLDGDLSTNPIYCFVAEKPENGWALYILKWSLVTHIQLLNADIKGYVNLKNLNLLFSLIRCAHRKYD